MQAESNRILEILNSDVDLTALVDDKIYPLVADQDAALPFVNYHIREESTYSKEGKLEIIVSTTSFAKTYTQAIEVADTVKDAFEKNTVPEMFVYLGGSPNYNEENLISIQQNYKYKN